MPRLAEYDSNAVVEKALNRFWGARYSECDVEQLTRATGVNRHSLYGAFGGKAGLFRAALSLYVESVAQSFIDTLQRGSGLSAIEQYLALATQSISKQSRTDKGRRGCFITNTVIEMGRTDAKVNAIIEQYYRKVESAFRDAVARGQEDGSIRADIDPDATAKWLVLTSQGMSVAARFNRQAADVVEVVRAALSPLPSHQDRKGGAR